QTSMAPANATTAPAHSTWRATNHTNAPVTKNGHEADELSDSGERQLPTVGPSRIAPLPTSPLRNPAERPFTIRCVGARSAAAAAARACVTRAIAIIQ